MKLHLSSGHTCGLTCSCGAPVYAYHRGRTYKPSDPMPPIDQISMYWELICEWGHYQPTPPELDGRLQQEALWPS